MEEVRKNACSVLHSRLKILTGIFSIWLATLFTGCSWNDSSHWWDQAWEAPVHTVQPNENTSAEDLNMLQRRFANEIRDFLKENNIQNFLTKEEISLIAYIGKYHCKYYQWNIDNGEFENTIIILKVMALMECIAHASSDYYASDDDLISCRTPKELQGKLEAMWRQEKLIKKMNILLKEIVEENQIDLKKLSEILRIWKEREKTTHLLSWVLENSYNIGWKVVKMNNDLDQEKRAVKLWAA